MKNGIICLIFLSGLFSCKSQDSESIKLLDVASFKEAITKSNVQLIDVRTPEEYNEGHINDAKLIDYFSSDFKEQLQQLDKTQPVYLYCKSGGRSGKASRMLSDLGFTEIYDLKGGYNAWSSN